MIKKTLALVLALMMGLSLVACGNSGSAPSSSAASSTSAGDGKKEVITMTPSKDYFSVIDIALESAVKNMEIKHAFLRYSLRSKGRCNLVYQYLRHVNHGIAKAIRKPERFAGALG